jgi:TIR domain
MEHDVFISHAHKDKSVADAICEKLESAGVKCWIAGRDISADKDWRDATRNAIGSSHVVVLVLSENANAAPHIKREIAHAFYTRRVIISFRLGGALPRREFLFYLGKVPGLDSARPPTEQDLKALTARIQGLLTADTVSADPVPPEKASQTDSWISGLQASHYRTLGVLKWAAMATALFAVVWFLWFTLWQTKERTSLAENELRPTDHRSNVPPEPAPPAGPNAVAPKPTDNFTRFGLWQGADTGSKPTAQQGLQDRPLTATAQQPASVPPSSRSDVPAEEPAALASASVPHTHSLPPSAVHRAPHYHHPPYQGTRSQEPDKTSDRAMSPRDALQSQLKATEAEVQTAQKNADQLAIELETLHNELKESKTKGQTAENFVDVLTKERDGLRQLLEKTDAKAQASQNDADLARRQRDSLQTQLNEAEAKAEMIQKNADLAATQRDAFETELDETKKRAELAETQASLAAIQRSAMEAELKKAQEEAQLAHESADLAISQRKALEAQMSKIQEEVAPLARHDANLAGSNDSQLNSQWLEEPGDAQPQEEADSANDQPGPGQIQPPNPGPNAKLPPLTQALNSSVHSTGP